LLINIELDKSDSLASLRMAKTIWFLYLK